MLHDGAGGEKWEPDYPIQVFYSPRHSLKTGREIMMRFWRAD